MNVGSMRRAQAWLVALSVIGTACNRTDRGLGAAKVNHGVALFSQEQTKGHWKAIASPDKRVVRHYDPDLPNSNQVVVWAYGHKSTTIHFADPLITKDPVCNDSVGICTWNVPPGLLKPDEKSHTFKYSITGKHDDTTDLDSSDPWIEVDR